MFTELMERDDEDIYLGIFEQTLAAVPEVENFDWDTALKELDEPWPHHIPTDLNLRGMVAWLTGRPDVTTYLYDVRELQEYEARRNDLTAVMDAVMV